MPRPALRAFKMSFGFVAIIGKTASPEGLMFYRVKISRRRSGWIQSEALISSAQTAADARLLINPTGNQAGDQAIEIVAIRRQVVR